MRQRRLIIGTLVVDGVLIVILILCLTLGISLMAQEQALTHLKKKPRW